jgi:hypothetical protein
MAGPWPPKVTIDGTLREEVHLMRHENEKASRDWREIIADSYNESDPEKIRKLAEELDRALDQRDKILVRSERSWTPRDRSA